MDNFESQFVIPTVFSEACPDTCVSGTCPAPIIPPIFEECFTYEKQILWLKARITELQQYDTDDTDDTDDNNIITIN